MPEERDIEKALRAWAKRRREDAGAPAELHPARRRMLHAEISRMHGAARRPPGLLFRLLCGTPLRLALNLSAVAVLVFAVAVFIPRLRRPPATLAEAPNLLADSKRKAVETGEPAMEQFVPVQSAPAAQPQQNLRETAATASSSDLLALGDKVSLHKNPAASAVPGVAPPAPTLDQPTLAENSATALAAAPVDQPAAATPSIETMHWTNSPINTDRRAVAAKNRRRPSVLSSFRTELAGDRLRVIDADGSVYSGTLAIARQQLEANGYVALPQTRSFRVSGTNLTRHLRVVFSGNLVFANQSPLHGEAVASGTASGGGGFGGGGGVGVGGSLNVHAVSPTNSSLVPGAAAQPAVESVAVAGALPPPPQYRVQGRARVGTNEILINAIQVAH